MADIRIKDLATTATTTASDDFMAVDGAINGTRKLSAAAPAFLTSVTTPSLTSPAATNLTLGLGTGGTALTLASSTLAATFAGAVTTTSTTDRTDGTFGTGSLSTLGGASISKSLQVGSTAGDTYSLAVYATGGTNIVAMGGGASPKVQGFTNVGGAQALALQPLGGALNVGTAATVATFNGTAAGASNAGALVVAGGISAGNTGSAASYFGGAVNVAGAVSVTANATNTFGSGGSTASELNRIVLNGSSGSAAGSTIYFQSAGVNKSYIGRAGSVLGGTSDNLLLYSVSDNVVIYGGATLAATFSSSAATFAGAVTIAGTVIHTLSATPASAAATGTVGTMSWDASYIYICTAANTWKRVAIATW